MPAYFAHSANASGTWHELPKHLCDVADLAQHFADRFGAGEVGFWAGLWHDLGKFAPAFQDYLKNPGAGHGPDHSSAGAVFACQFWDGLAFLIAGHHAGLPSFANLKKRLREKQGTPGVDEALRTARQELASLGPEGPLSQRLPASALGRPACEMFLRMVFSALVDADFLDTERHFQPARAAQRGGTPSLQDLWPRFVAAQARLTGQGGSAVQMARDEIYTACLAAADQPPGLFRLTVPTGGGKTRSGMGFALRHALRHGLERVIVALPYTSIIEQTADVYRTIFGDDAVLEHHSAVGARDDGESPVTARQVWARLASENWDAPIVVTTTVQLFESLFSNRPGSCRKLHRLARSVIILDEVQTLPVHLLDPIWDVLAELASNYGTSVVLSTATQPSLTGSPYLKGMPPAREIVPDPGRYFQALKRVCYELPAPGDRWSWERVAEEMRTSPQALTVVNTKADANALLDALGEPSALHLSTQLCGAHRAEVLDEVRRRLGAGEPCLLVATQVVEAGVDIDFPLVLRAVGPLDRIVQAAGRCNREGRLAAGRVVIFDPLEGRSPPGAYRTGSDTAAVLLARGCDLHDPQTYEHYFQLLFGSVETDRERVQDLRRALDFEEVARRFRLIDDDTTPVVVRPARHREAVDKLVGYVRNAEEVPRWALRRLQRFLVNVRSRHVPSYERDGLLQPLAPGLWEWLGGYDQVRGIVGGPRSPDELVV